MLFFFAKNCPIGRQQLEMHKERWRIIVVHFSDKHLFPCSSQGIKISGLLKSASKQNFALFHGLWMRHASVCLFHPSIHPIGKGLIQFDEVSVWFLAYAWNLNHPSTKIIKVLPSIHKLTPIAIYSNTVGPALVSACSVADSGSTAMRLVGGAYSDISGYKSGHFQSL